MNRIWQEQELLQWSRLNRKAIEIVRTYRTEAVCKATRERGEIVVEHEDGTWSRMTIAV